jgi:hypothetical protein
MTTDELERDLMTLAEPQADDERLRLALRATLGEQLQARRPKIRRTLWVPETRIGLVSDPAWSSGVGASERGGRIGE